MISVTVEADNGDTQYYGISANQLQDNVVVSGSAISGTLKWTESYEQFSGNKAEQSGNYLVLKFTPTKDAKVTTMVQGGTMKKPVDATSDGYCVYRLTDTQTQKIDVTVTKGKKTKTTTYDLTQLTLTPQ